MKLLLKRSRIAPRGPQFAPARAEEADAAVDPDQYAAAVSFIRYPHALNGQEKGSPMCGTHAYGSLLLDLTGRIRFCGSAVAALAGQSPEDLECSPIKSLLPRLPLLEHTPGYNLAVSIALLRACWSPCCLVASDGRTVEVEVRVEPVRVARPPVLAVTLRWLQAVEPRRADTMPKQTTDTERADDDIRCFS